MMSIINVRQQGLRAEEGNLLGYLAGARMYPTMGIYLLESRITACVLSVLDIALYLYITY